MTALLDELLAKCQEQGASDLHLVPGQPPLLRGSGALSPVAGSEPLSPDDVEAMARHMAEGFAWDDLERKGSLDGALSAASGARFRFNVFKRQGQLAVALRRLEDSARGLVELGLDARLYELSDHADGLVVVSGPTGSGKSTTLAALVHRINDSRACHVITIEDPIEYLHPSRQALVNQRQIGIDAPDFDEALVSALRQDPDVILVGEVRERSTIRTAITAAETGHLVFTTVHAGDCVGAVERLVAVFPADDQPGIRRQLALVLRGIVAQRLIPVDGTLAQAPTREAQVQRRRRVVTSEVLRNTSAVANMIASGKAPQLYHALEAGAAAGMHTFDQDLARLWSEGWLSEVSATALARNPRAVRDRQQVLAKNGGRGLRRAGGRA